MRFTVFTPTYNRADSLKKLYESLLGQSCFDFEWLIVDDGSADDTAAVVKGFTGENKFPVRYLSKENGGKHTAHNLALEKAQGDYFFCVDSDDFVAENAMEKLCRFVDTLADTRGVAAYKTYPDGSIIGSGFPEGVAEATAFDLYERYGCTGDFAFIYPTRILREFPFPVFWGERFVTESVIFDRLDRVCPMALLRCPVSVCEYMADGYSQNANAVIRNNPNGYCLYFLQRIDLYSGFKKRLVCAGKYWCFRYISKNKELKYRGKHRLTAALGAAVGLVFRVYYKVCRGI